MLKRSFGAALFAGLLVALTSCVTPAARTPSRPANSTAEPQNLYWLKQEIKTYVDSGRKGTVGVLGPTRMRYSRAIPLVEAMAHAVSRVLETNRRTAES